MRTFAAPAVLLAAAVAAGDVIGIGPGVAAARAATFRLGDVGITVPDGFEVERAAAPPLVERPVSLAFDDEGRLHVAESSGSNAKLVEQAAARADPRAHQAGQHVDHGTATHASRRGLSR